MNEDIHHITAPEEVGKVRLDKFLTEHMPEYSRSRIQALIKQGQVKSGEEVVTDCAHVVTAGEVFCVTVPEAEPSALMPSPIALSIVYEDEHVLVVDKPAGMTVHPGAGNHQDTLVNALLAHCGDSLSGIGGVERPGIVHRLDKDTSGLLLVAKHDKAHRALAEQLQERVIKRVYQAVVWGVPSPSAGTVHTHIGRHPKDRKKMAVLKTSGKEAITHYRLLERLGAAASMVECRLETGRTHQIRVHMTHLGYPIIGDAMYKKNIANYLEKLTEDQRVSVEALKRQALHALKLGFTHPISGEWVEYTSALPNDIVSVIDALKNAEKLA